MAARSGSSSARASSASDASGLSFTTQSANTTMARLIASACGLVGSRGSAIVSRSGAAPITRRRSAREGSANDSVALLPLLVLALAGRVQRVGADDRLAGQDTAEDELLSPFVVGAFLGD